MAIELTENQCKAIHQSEDCPPLLLDPATKATYVLIPADDYADLRALAIEKTEAHAWGEMARRARRAWMAENPY